MSSVPAASYTLRIIKYLAGHGGPVRASTVSRDLDLPRSTTYHLMSVMQQEGFLLHSPENQAYALSPLLADIGSAVLASNALGRMAKPILERLVAETKLPIVAHLGVLHHSDVVYASKVSAPHAPSVVTSIGVRLPAHLTATGRAMLAGLSRDQVRAIYPSSQSLVTRTGPGPTTDRATERAAGGRPQPRLGGGGRRYHPGVRVRRRRGARPHRLPGRGSGTYIPQQRRGLAPLGRVGARHPQRRAGAEPAHPGTSLTPAASQVAVSVPGYTRLREYFGLFWALNRCRVPRDALGLSPWCTE